MQTAPVCESFDHRPELRDAVAGDARILPAPRLGEISGEYVDTGWSGAKASRPELNHLIPLACNPSKWHHSLTLPFTT